MTLSDAGSYASILGLLVTSFLVVKVYNLHVKIGKIDNSEGKKENTSFFSLFISQNND